MNTAGLFNVTSSEYDEGNKIGGVENGESLVVAPTPGAYFQAKQGGSDIPVCINVGGKYTVDPQGWPVLYRTSFFSQKRGFGPPALALLACRSLNNERNINRKPMCLVRTGQPARQFVGCRSPPPPS